MEAKEALLRWSKHQTEAQAQFLQHWLQSHGVDRWAAGLHLAGVEVTLDQYGVLAVTKARIMTFCRETFVAQERFCTLHLHFDMYGSFRCIGSTDIDGVRYSNLPNGAVNETQIVYGKRKPNLAEGQKILTLVKNFNGIYYSERVQWASQGRHRWCLGETWHQTEVAIRQEKRPGF